MSCVGTPIPVQMYLRSVIKHAYKKEEKREEKKNRKVKTRLTK